VVNRFSLRRFEVIGAREPTSWQGGIAVPVIDDVPLYIRINEQLMPGMPAGAIAPPQREWLGEPYVIPGDQDTRATVIEGGCHVSWCCGVHAAITIDEQVVTWSDFVVGPCEEIDLGPFTFDRTEYEAAIANVMDVPTIAWRING